MISLALTNHNRTDLLFEAVRRVLYNPFISEIVIMDDASNQQTIKYLQSKFHGIEKVKIITRPHNVGMHTNKRDAIFNCTNEWVIIFDSDNVIDADYLEHIPAIDTLDPNIIYMPELAAPNFIYTDFVGMLFDTKKTQAYIGKNIPMFDCLLNTCNYLVHRNTYLEIWEFNQKVDAADTILFLYRWLKAGKKFTIIPHAKYFHRVHDGSGFMKDVVKNMNDADRIKKLICEL